VRARRTAFERQVWRVSARITEYKLADNDEVHLILVRRGWHMIAKMPSPACLPKITRDRRAIVGARRFFESRCRPATREWRSLGAIAQIDGVGFWDPQRGQRGHARNDAQLHPVTRIRILSRCS
jgi:hypothetical protein